MKLLVLNMFLLTLSANALSQSKEPAVRVEFKGSVISLDRSNNTDNTNRGASNRPDRVEKPTTNISNVTSEFVKTASLPTIDGLRRIKALNSFKAVLKLLVASNVFNTLMITQNPEKLPELMKAMTPEYWKDVKDQINSINNLDGVVDRIVTDTRMGVEIEIEDRKQKKENTESLEIERIFWENFNSITSNYFNSRNYNDYLNKIFSDKNPNPLLVDLYGKIIGEVRYNVTSVGMLGLAIKPELTISNAQNHTNYDILFLCSFAYENGVPLKDFNGSYSDNQGNVCISWPLNPCCNPTTYNFDNPIPELFIPYSELHLEQKAEIHSINIFVELRIDGRIIGKRLADNFKISY